MNVLQLDHQEPEIMETGTKPKRDKNRIGGHGTNNTPKKKKRK
jgi:hypothetical protein